MSVSTPRVLAVIALIAVVALVAVSAPASAQADVAFVDSNVTTDTTWTAADGPYRVVGNVTIAPNATLTLEPGTTVEFAEGVTLAVAGGLKANGTAAEPVHLTASRTLQTPGSWGRILTTGSGSPTVSLTHANLEYGTDGIAIGTADSTVHLEDTSLARLDGNGITIERGGGATTLEVRKSTIQDVANAGIGAARTDLVPVGSVRGWTITDTSFEGVETGIDLHAERISRLTVRDTAFEAETAALSLETDRLSRSRLRGNSISGSAVGIAVETADVSTVSIRDNDIVDTQTGLDLHLTQNIYGLSIHENAVTEGATGLQIRHDPLEDGYYSFDLSVTANEITDLAGDGFVLQTSLFSDQRLAVRNNTVRANERTGITLDVGAFRDAVVVDNHVAENGRSGLVLRARDVHNTVLDGNVVRENGRSGIDVTADRRMAGVTITDNELLDNAREGLWIRNGMAADGNYSVTDNVIAANAYGVVLAGPQTGHLVENAIVFNTVSFGDRVVRPDAGTGVGVYVTDDASDVELRTNDIYGQRIGLLTRIDGTVGATDNYWGATSGPYHRSINPEGEGNAVETEQGWVEIVEAKSERTGEAFARPNAVLSITPNPTEQAQPVTISGAQSFDPDGTIRTYQLTVADRTTASGSPHRSTQFETPGSYPVSLWVEDDMGIESEAPATATLSVTEPVATTTPPTTQAPATSTTTVQETTPSTPPPDEPGPGILGWIAALLGAVLYGTALIFGTKGLYETLTEQPLSVRGRRIHLLAAGGVVVWAVGSLLSSAPLARAAVIGLGAWLLFTGAAYVAVRANQ